MQGTPTEPPKPPAGGTPPPDRPARAEPVPGQAVEPAATPHERIDGLRSWLSEVERKLNVRTIAIGVIAVLALAAGILGIVLAMGVEHDAAQKSDLETLRAELATVKETAGRAAQEDVQTLTDRVSALEDKVAQSSQGEQSVDQQISVIQDDIDDLRSQINDLESAPPAEGTTTTP